MSETKLMPCPFCGKELLTPDPLVVVCSSGHYSIDRRLHENAYCWQQLSAEKEKVRKLVEALNFCASYKNTLHIERVMENERCCCTSCHAEKILSEVEAEK